MVKCHWYIYMTLNKDLNSCLKIVPEVEYDNFTIIGFKK